MSKHMLIQNVYFKFHYFYDATVIKGRKRGLETTKYKIQIAGFRNSPIFFCQIRYPGA